MRVEAVDTANTNGDDATERPKSVAEKPESKEGTAKGTAVA